MCSCFFRRELNYFFMLFLITLLDTADYTTVKDSDNLMQSSLHCQIVQDVLGDTSWSWVPALIKTRKK